MNRTSVLLAVLGLAGLVPAVGAQQPGQVVVSFEPRDSSQAADVERLAGTAIARIETFFDLPFRSPVTIAILPDRARFDEHFRNAWGIPNTECWMVGAALPEGLILLSPRVWSDQACEHGPRDRAHLMGIVAHELVHVLHGQYNPTEDFEGMDPLGWFVEGVAVLASGQLEARRGDVGQATMADALPARLEDVWSGRFRYGLAGSLVEHVDRTRGREVLRRLLTVTTQEQALEILEITESMLLASWKASPEAFGDTALTVLELTFDTAHLGTNTFHARVRNRSDAPVLALLDLRAVPGMWMIPNVQGQFWVDLAPGDEGVLEGTNEFRRLSPEATLRVMIGPGERRDNGLISFRKVEFRVTYQTGHRGVGWARDSTLVEVYNDDVQLDPFHELAHIVAAAAGSPPPALSEGFAVYASERLGADALRFLGFPGKPVHQVVCELRGTPDYIPVTDLFALDNIGARGDRAGREYAEAGSFVRYLVESRGLARFREAYAALRSNAEVGDNMHRLSGIYAMAIEDMESGWLEAVADGCTAGG